jgi:hypothetical protein
MLVPASERAQFVEEHYACLALASPAEKLVYLLDLVPVLPRMWVQRQYGRSDLPPERAARGEVDPPSYAVAGGAEVETPDEDRPTHPTRPLPQGA